MNPTRETKDLGILRENHPLARNLRLAWCPAAQKSKGIRDQKRNKNGAISAGSNFPYYHLSNGTNYTYFTNDADIGGTTDFHAMVYCNIASAVAFMDVIGAYGGTAPDRGGWLIEADGGGTKVLAITKNGAAGLLTSGYCSVPFNKNICIHLRLQASSLTCRVNGINSTASTSSPISYEGTRPDIRWGGYGTSMASGSKVFAVYIWDRALSYAECRQLEEDPYLLFRKNPARLWSNTAAAATFKAAWARNSNVLVTPGLSI